MRTQSSSENTGWQNPPATNELAAIYIGRCLVDSDISPQDKEKVRKNLASFEGVNIVYPQNTADTLNIVVPEFPKFDEAMAQAIEDGQLESVSGGEGILALFGAIGIGFASAVGATTILAGGTIGAGAIAIGATIVIGTTVAGLAVGLGVAAGVGVGIAAGLGAFDGSGSGGDVGIGLVE